MMDDADSLIPCPYNKSHVLYKSRMQTHLKKCSYANLHPQKNVDVIKMKICQFNTNHHVPAAELDSHHATCPDIGTMARFLTQSGSGKRSAIPYTPIELPPTDENWDDDADSATYNPEEHAVTGVILRAAQGVPKAERKTFRLRERERINRIRENEEALVKEHRVVPKPQPVVVVEKHAFTEQALRHPKEGQLGMGRGRQMPTNNATSRGEDFPIQGIGRAYTLKGMSNGLQNVPLMRPKGVDAAIAGISNRLQNLPLIRPKGVDDDSTAGSSSASTYSSGNSRPSSANSVADGDGFVEQRGKKNKKKGQAKSTSTMQSQVPGVNDQASVSHNPLTTPDSFSTFSAPGLPGKGRGRIPKN